MLLDILQLIVINVTLAIMILQTVEIFNVLAVRRSVHTAFNAQTAYIAYSARLDTPILSVVAA